MIVELMGCYPPPVTIVVEAPEESLAEEALAALLRPFQPLREQFTAITGIGLESEVTGSAGLRRRALVGDGSVPVLSYLAIGNSNGHKIIFIHGSPGLAEEWASFLSEVPTGQYRIAVDRPGFGESSAEALVDLSAQARAIEPLMSSPGGESVVLVGYSYGGPVALQLAVDYPDKVAALLLIGSAGDPALEEIDALQELAATEFFSELLPHELSNANEELLALRSELEDLSGRLGQIAIPVTIVQGLEDTLVPPENARYLERMLAAGPQRVILIEGADHFLPWSHTDILEAALECVIVDAFGYSPDGPRLSEP